MGLKIDNFTDDQRRSLDEWQPVYAARFEQGPRS